MGKMSPPNLCARGSESVAASSTQNCARPAPDLSWEKVFMKSAAFYDMLYAAKEYAAEAEHVHALIQAHGKSDRNTLLDVACGTGGHLSHLKHHYAAEGLDIDPNLLAIAQNRLPDVQFHHADMVSFDLGRRFHAVVCLFSAIGYVVTLERLRAAIGAMARHLQPGGILLVEPWLTPDGYLPGTVHALFAEQPDLKICRMNVAATNGSVCVLDFHYLVGTPDRVEHFTEHHELGLFTSDEYLQAAGAAGLEATFDPQGLIGRGLLIGLRPLSDV